MMRTTVSLDDIRRSIGAMQTMEEAGCDGFDGYRITFTVDQLERLARRLGWRPTPTLAECLDDRFHFVCPSCGESSAIEHESSGPCDLRPVRGFNSDGHLVIENVDASCCTEGEWWLRCRSCLAIFNPPAGLDIVWI